MIPSISQPLLEAFSVLKETLIVSAGQRNIVTSQTVAGDYTACKESGFLMKGRLDLKKIVILTPHLNYITKPLIAWSLGEKQWHQIFKLYYLKPETVFI